MLLSDISGQRFGRLVVGDCGSTLARRTYWWCVCDCGTGKAIESHALKSGKTLSCGCFRLERLRSDGLRHGHARKGARDPLYSVWATMLARCSNPRHISYDLYGGRGIRVCPQWRDFAVFLRDVGERPTGTALDRINNDGNYEPGNVRWATPTEQARNRRPRRWGKAPKAA